MSAAAFKVWFLYCLRFFFYCSGALRDLHSFPTRRSSDLKPAATLSTSRRSRRATPASRSPSPAGVGGAVQQGRAVKTRVTPCVLLRNRWFESRSLQRRVCCERDFLDHGWRGRAGRRGGKAAKTRAA